VVSKPDSGAFPTVLTTHYIHYSNTWFRLSAECVKQSRY